MTIPIDEAEPADPGRRAHLFVEGQIAPVGAEERPVAIRRGMPIRCQDGEDAGQVAAVVGVSPNTAASRYRYALAKLSEVWHGRT